MTDDEWADIAWSETMAAAGWPEIESRADKLEADAAREREQAYWASPEGVERQLAEAELLIATGHAVEIPGNPWKA